MSFTTVYDVLDCGEVELLDCMCSDLDVVNAAKVSFSTYVKEMDESSIGLIKYLVKNKHATPFEHCIFKFSMRYHIPKNVDYYIPSYDKVRKQIGKPGSYSFEEISDPEVKNAFYSIFRETVLQADRAYYEMIELGIAKEIARCVLPVTQYTDFIWTVNARSLINFISLRNDKNAQYEINEYAKIIEIVFQEKMPFSYEAFIESDRAAI